MCRELAHWKWFLLELPSYVHYIADNTMVLASFFSTTTALHLKLFRSHIGATLQKTISEDLGVRTEFFVFDDA